MTSHDRNRDERSSKHGGKHSAVLPTADSPKIQPVTAPMEDATEASERPNAPGKDKEQLVSKSNSGASAHKASNDKSRNPDHKR